VLEDNKRAWDSKLKFSLWVDRVTTKKSLGTSPFQLVYGTEAVFPTQLALPVAKLFQDYEGEPDHMIRRIHQIVEVQQIREQVRNAAYSRQQKIKQAFDRKVRKKEFEIGDLVHVSDITCLGPKSVHIYKWREKRSNAAHRRSPFRT
jgi:hypothetical protein